MSARPLIIASLLGGAIGVPYLASRAPSNADGTSGSFFGLNTAASTQTNTPLASGLSLPTSPDSAPLLKSYPAIEQVLRFDVTKAWVYRQWARKSTWPTELGLQGVRVQLVTGTHPSALAGSLTYFFNVHEQIEHISFHGRSGDPAPLVAFLTRTYQLQPAAAPAGEQLYQLMRGERVQSELRVRPDAVSTSASPHSGFAIKLELARPNSNRLLPPRGVPLNVPPVASAPMPTAPGASASTSPAGGDGSVSKSIFKSYFDKGRYATPQEEDPLHWNRWPN